MINKSNKKLENIFNLPPQESPEITVDPVPLPAKEITNLPIINLEEKLEEFDKIAAALPRVKGLGDISDNELDGLANKAEKAFNDLMDLGMQVDPRYGARMFEVAVQMLNAAVTAKTNKIDKKLKMVDLQLKKLSIDKKSAPTSGDENNHIQGTGVILMDRNSIMEKLRALDSSGDKKSNKKDK